ncbi:MAG: sigma 54-interacting transcriptional regulator [Polyangiaceae bacterium]
MEFLDETTEEGVETRSRRVSEPAPYLFVVLECARPRAGGMRVSLEGVDEVVIGRGAERRVTRTSDGSTKRVRVEVPDARTSGRHARLTRTSDGFRLEDLGSTNGTVVARRRITSVLLDDEGMFETGETLFLLRTSVVTRGPARDLDAGELAALPPGLRTLIPSLADELASVARVAPSEVPVLLLGESGTGKEVLARAIHVQSKRTGEFVAVNCAALPSSLLESQLFGYKKGAFSGAVKDELGLVRASEGGTLFLDEIGDMSPSSQTALLRVLQEKEVLPVGGTKPVRVDLRVVAATHQKLDGASEFRRDLYARLAGFIHRLRPFRERREDAGLILASVLSAAGAPEGIRTSVRFGRALLRYAFPLNMRELTQIVGVSSVLATDGTLDLPEGASPLRAALEEVDAEELPDRGASAGVGAGRVGHMARVGATTLPITPPAPLDETAALVRDALVRHRGNVSEIARELGKTRMQIHRWMKRYGLDPEMFRGQR